MYQTKEHVSPSLFIWVRVAYRLSIGWSGSAGSSILGNGIWGIGQPFLATAPDVPITYPDIFPRQLWFSRPEIFLQRIKYHY